MNRRTESAGGLVFDFPRNQHSELDQYLARSGYQALEQSISRKPADLIGVISQSGLRGRGGAAFPAATKLEMVRSQQQDEKIVICNADEGEPGTFKDRFIMTHLPYLLLEGMTLAALMTGVQKGFLYIRHEYPEARKKMDECIRNARDRGYLGENILGSSFSFDIEIFQGAGSYLCGEETALLNSMEGKKGRPRLKPPYPVRKGLWGKPTLIHNVETLSNIPRILYKGADWYLDMGTDDSPGTKLISLSGDVNFRGLYEIPFGTSFLEIIESHGGGIKNGKKIKAVNIGGASGVLLPPEKLITPLEYGACGREGITIGSGAVFVLDETRSILDNVHNRVQFFLHESCGKCTPCREGLRQADIILTKLRNGNAESDDVKKLVRYTNAIQEASFCGLGQAAGNSLKSSLEYYMDEYLDMCGDLAPDLNKKESA